MSWLRKSGCQQVRSHWGPSVWPLTWPWQGRMMPLMEDSVYTLHTRGTVISGQHIGWREGKNKDSKEELLPYTWTFTLVCVCVISLRQFDNLYLLNITVRQLEPSPRTRLQSQQSTTCLETWFQQSMFNKHNILPGIKTKWEDTIKFVKVLYIQHAVSKHFASPVTPHCPFIAVWSACCPVHESISLLTESFADVGHGLEDAVREVDLDLHVLHVGQLEAQQFVLRREKQPCIRLDAVLVQCPVGFQQPSLLLLPPQSMVWPVLLHIWRERKERRGWLTITPCIYLSG